MIRDVHKVSRPARLAGRVRAPPSSGGSSLLDVAMPSVHLTVDQGCGLDYAKVAQIAHDAVKNGIGKPDQCLRGARQGRQASAQSR